MLRNIYSQNLARSLDSQIIFIRLNLGSSEPSQC